MRAHLEGCRVQVRKGCRGDKLIVKIEEAQEGLKLLRSDRLRKRRDGLDSGPAIGDCTFILASSTKLHFSRDDVSVNGVRSDTMV